MNRVQAKTIYRRLFLLMVSIAGLYFLYRVRVILVPFVFAFFISYILNPAVRIIEDKKVPRTVAILIVYLVVGVLASFIVVFGIPHIVEELNKIGQAIPKLNAEIQSLIDRVENRYSKFTLPEGIRQVINERTGHFQNILVNMARAATTGILKLCSYLLILIVAPIFAFYMLKDTDRIKESLTLSIPRDYRSDILAIGRDIDEIIKGFLRGHLLISVIVGFLTALGMYLIGLDFALIIGIIAGVAELVPYLGPFISAVPTVALALLISKKTALYAVFVILVVQQLENTVISPKILGKSLGMHPLSVIFALMAGGELYGFAGIILALPVAATLKVILKYIYLKLVDEK